MTFNAPWFLVVAVPLVAALVGLAVTVARRRATALAAAGVTGRLARSRVPANQWLSLAGLAVLAAAIAGPTADLPTPRSAGTLIVAVDVSQSMTATDVSPSRLDAAKKAATQLIDAQPDSVDIGVVAFQSGGLSAGQPTEDHAAAEAAVGRLTASGGTSLSQAILASLSTITGKAVTLPEDGAEAPDLGDWGSATIVLFSDGEEDGDAEATTAAAGLAEAAGVHIETVGIGTTAGTTVDADGYSVHTALDEDKLTEIADTTGGSYHSSSDVSDLDDVADSIDRRLTVATKPLALAGAFAGVATVLLALGAGLNLLRTGRLI